MAYVIYYDDELDSSIAEKSKDTAMFRAAITAASKLELRTYCEPQKLIDYIQSEPKGPQLLVLDIRTQAAGRQITEDGMCGFAIATAAVKKWGKVPLLFLTVDESDTESRYRAMQFLKNYTDFISKTHKLAHLFLKLAVERVCSGVGNLEAGVLRIDPVTLAAWWRGKLLVQKYELNERQFKLVDCILNQCLVEHRYAAYDVIRGALKTGEEDIENEDIHSLMNQVRDLFRNFEEKEIGNPPEGIGDIFRNIPSRGYTLGSILL